jgi:hypothetical protein
MDKQAQATNLVMPPQPYRKTAGDVLFDLGVYGGLGYIANATISLYLTRQAVHLPHSSVSKIGKQAEQLFETLYSSPPFTLAMKPESVSYWAKLSNEIAFLGSGGWAMLFPMKWAEDHKSRIVQDLDHMLGSTPSSHQQRDAQQDALQNGPKQSAASLIFGRITSYATTITVALPAISKWTNISDHLAIATDKHFGHYLTTLKTPTTMVLGRPIPSIVDVFSKEVILAGTAAGLHYVFSKGAARAEHALQQQTHPSETPDTRIKAPQTQHERGAPPPQHSQAIA